MILTSEEVKCVLYNIHVYAYHVCIYSINIYTDSQRLCDYNVTTGSKLFLAQRPSPAPQASPAPPTVWTRKTEFWNKLRTFLLRYFLARDVENILTNMEEV